MSVVSLHSAPALVSEDALELAEQILARVRNGETVGLAVVEVRRDRSVACAWSQGDSYHRLNSGAARLANRLASEP